MSLEADLTNLVVANPLDLTIELERSRELLERLDSDRAEVASRVVGLEWLASLVNESGRKVSGERLTLHAAMREVLRESTGGRMRPQQLAAEIDRRGLYRMRDGRSVEAQQIHARVGHYSSWFERDGSYIVLR